jgi:hypothetical protein
MLSIQPPILQFYHLFWDGKWGSPRLSDRGVRIHALRNARCDMTPSSSFLLCLLRKWGQTSNATPFFHTFNLLVHFSPSSSFTWLDKHSLPTSRTEGCLRLLFSLRDVRCEPLLPAVPACLPACLPAGCPSQDLLAPSSELLIESFDSYL